jgi:hypothetical protein
LGKKRRTHPSFLSDDEAARERRRTEELVRSIVGKTHPARSVVKKQLPTIVIRNQTTRVGETSYFAVDFNDKDKIVEVYEKEVPEGFPFKLGFSQSETVAIYRLLGKALATMRSSQQSMPIGEKNRFAVDYDGTCRLVMLYQKEKTPLCQFKLAFDENETMWIIHFLKKARNFFWH